MRVLFITLVGCIDPQPTAIYDPTLWGPPVAEDHDPDPDVVEVHLSAAPTLVDWHRDTTTEQWAFNGTVPGPRIEIVQGQTLKVVFENRLSEDTTIHWHGLRIDNAMDGVPMVQDPVAADGGTFVYEFDPPDPPLVRSLIVSDRSQAIIPSTGTAAPPVASTLGVDDGSRIGNVGHPRKT